MESARYDIQTEIHFIVPNVRIAHHITEKLRGMAVAIIFPFRADIHPPRN